VTGNADVMIVVCASVCSCYYKWNVSNTEQGCWEVSGYYSIQVTFIRDVNQW